jgi:hypothetical protein
MATQFAPAASHRSHWYANCTGFPPSHVPGTAASTFPASGGPTMLGGVERTGAPAGYGGIASAAGLTPFMRSPSTQCAIPGTERQFVHCQNVQPLPSQFWAGTVG